MSKSERRADRKRAEQAKKRAEKKKAAQKQADKKQQAAPALFEELEPRVLFSTVTGVDADALLQEADYAAGGEVIEADVALDAGVAIAGAEEATRQEMVFVDTGVVGYEQLVEDIRSASPQGRELEVVLLDSERDGVEQISDFLGDREGLDAIHIVSHGSEGAAQLGNAWLTNDSLSGYEDAIGGWSDALSEDADLLFYGCDLAGGESGEALVGSIAKLTGADVAASTDDTGAAVLGGDWELEHTAGAVETSVAISSQLQDGFGTTLAANLPPVNAVPGAQSTPQDTDLVFASGAGNDIAVSDADAGANLLEVTLSVDHGTLRLDLPPVVTVGSEAQANSTATNPQAAADVAVAPDGSSVVVWQSTDQDGSSYGIYGQRYDAAGDPAGNEFLINTHTADAQTEPAVAIDDNGNFVVVWTSFNQDGVSSRGIYGQRYFANGSTNGGEFRVNSTIAGQQTAPDVAMSGNGDFVVAWTGQEGTDSYNAYFQRYDSAGVAQGSETKANGTSGKLAETALAMDAAGRFTVVWKADDGSGYGIYGQRLDASGVAQGSNFQVNSETTGSQEIPAIATRANGDFVVVWTSANQDGSGSGVYGQLFDADGTARGNEFLVNATTTGNQTDPSVAMNGTGFVVAWTGDAGGYTDVFAREFDADGNAVGSEFTVNSVTTYYQWYPSVSTNANGDYSIVWNGYGGVDTSGIAMQRFSAPVDLDISAGDSGGVGSMTFRGTIAAINTALESMVYTPDAGFTGSDTLTITTNDLGNTGTGGAQTDVDTVDITVTAHNDGAAIWAENGSTTPETSAWDGTSFGSEGATAAIGNWRTVQGAEAPTRDEKIVVGIEDSGVSTGMMWNGSSWAYISPAKLGEVSETYWWGVDVAYESQSGDAVMVFNDNSQTAGNKLRFSVWDGTSWTPQTSVTAYTGSEPQQLKLASDPNSDGMVLVVSDSSADDHVLVWNGSTWGNALMVDASGTGEDDQSGISVVYEGQSGRAMVVYGRNNDASAYYRVWNGATWEAEGSLAAPGGVTAQTTWTTLASDPNSDRIALSVLTSGGTGADIWLSVWDGTTWQAATVAETSATGSVSPNAAVAFESQSGQAVAVYGQNGQSEVRYRTWDAVDGWSAELIGPNVGATPNSMTLDSDPGSNRIMLSVQDSGSDLNMVLWDAGTWGAVTEHETDTGETKNQPFVFLWDSANTPPTTSGIPDLSVNENGGFTFMDLKAHFADAQDPDTDLVYTIEGNTSPALFNSATIVSGSTFRLDYGEDLNGTSDITIRATDTGGLFVESTFTVTVNPVNDAPVLDFGGSSSLTTITEDDINNPGNTVAEIVASAGGDRITDVDTGALEGIAIFNAASGNGVWEYSVDGGSNWNALGAVSSSSSLLLRDTDRVRFVPNGTLGTTANIGFRAWDQTSDSAGSKVDSGINGGATAFSTSSEFALITVTSVNDGPSVVDLDGDILNYTEGDGAVLIEQGDDALVSDADSLDFAGGSLNVEVDSGLIAAEDVFRVRNQGTGSGQIGVSGSDVTYSGVVIGKFAGGTGTTPLTFTFNASATAGSVTALVQNITYENVNLEDPTAGARSVTIDITDGDGGATSTQNLAINVTAINDPPSLGTTGTTLAYSENDGAVAIDPGLIVSDPDHSNLTGATVWIASGFASGEDSLAFVDQLGITGSYDAGTGTLALSGTASVADYETALRSVTYSNSSEIPDTTDRSIGFQVSDGIAVAGSNRTVSVASINDDPTNAGTLPADVTVMEDLSLESIDLSAIDLSDVDASNELITLRLTTSSGGNLYSSSDFDVTVLGSGTGTITLTGGVADLNSYLDASGRIQYQHGTTHMAGDNVDTIQVDVWDNGNTGTGGGGVIALGTVNVDITPVNDAPIRTAGSITDLVVTEDSGLTSLGLGGVTYGVGGGTDESSQTLTYDVTVVPDPNFFGKIYLADGTTQVSTGVYSLADIQGMQFAPAADENGGPSFFSFRITDSGGTPNGGADSITETIRLDITPVNDLPVAAADSAGVVEGGTIVIDLAANDSDIDHGIDLASIAIVSGPTNGSLVVNLNGTVEYTHSGSNTVSDSFTYTIDDTSGQTSLPATVTLTITAVDDDAPTPVVNTGSTVAEGGTDTISNTELAFTDSEAATSAITYTVTTAPGSGHLALSASPAVAITSFTQAQLDAGQVVYVHGGTNTTSDSFGFDVDDGAGNTVTGQTFNVAIIAVDDDAPTPVVNTGSTVAEGGTDTLSNTELAFTDSEAATSAITYSVTTAPGNGHLALSASPTVAITSFTQAQLDAGQVVYVHDGTNTTTDSFGFDVDDGAGNTVTGQTFNVAIIAVDDDAPTLVVNTGSTVAEGGTDTISNTELAFTDTEAATSAISYTVTTAPGNGHLALSASPTVTITSFTQAQLDAGQVVYVHGGTNTTSDSFGFDVDDGAGNAVTGQTFNLAITGVDDDAPTQVVNTGSTVAEGGTDTLSNTELAFTDTEAATSAISYTVTTAPGNGHLALSAAPTVAITSFTQAQLDAGQVVYVHGGTNTTSDSFGFDIDDGAGNAVTAQTFNLAITAVDDDAPTPVVNTGSTVAEGGTDTIASSELAFTDSEAATSAITYSVTMAPGNGHLALSAAPTVAITSFTQAQLDAGQVVYVHDGTNTTTDSFGFDVDDGAGNAVTGQTFNLAIIGVDDDAPTQVVNTGSTVAEGGTDTISNTELAFTDTEAATSAITYTVTTAPGNGHLALSASPTVAITSFTQAQLDVGQVVYVHDGTNTTSDSFGFDVDDGAGNAVTGQTFNVAIIAVDDDAPTLVVNTGSTVAEGGTDTISSSELAFTDTEAATSAISYTVTTAPGNGHLALSASPTVTITSFTQAQLDAGQVVYVHGGTNTTSDSFGFDIDDGAGNAVTAQTFNLAITAVDDDAPTPVVNTGSTVAEGGTDTISNTELAFTDTEAATSAITYSVTTAPGNGHLALSAAPTVAITSFTQAQLDAGQVVYVHDDTNTTSDSFGFDVDDGAGNAVTGQTFNVAITAADDDAPTLVVNTGSTVAEGGTDTISNTELAFTDTEAATSAITYTVTTAPGNGHLALSASPTVAITSFTQAQLDAGQVVYVHNGTNTTSDSFGFDVDDGAGNAVTGQTFNVAITAADDDAPTLVVNTGSTVAEGGTDTISNTELAFTDTEAATSAISYTVTTAPGNGHLALSASPTVTITSFTQAQLDAGQVVYVHGGTNTTSDSFGFDIDDGAGNAVTAQTFNLAITAVDDDAPTPVVNTGSTVAEGGTDTIASSELAFTDSEAATSAITYSVTMAPGNGHLALSAAPTVAITSFTQAQLDAGQVVYVHSGTNTTTDSFGFDVDDGAGNAVTGQTFNLAIIGVDDDAPTQVVNTGSTVAEGGTDTISNTELAFTDTEAATSAISYTVTTAPGNGHLALSASPTVTITSFTQAQLDAGQVVYVHGGTNTTSDSFGFDVDDGAGNAVTGQTFNLAITGVDDDAPTQVVNTGSTVAEGGTDTLSNTELAFTDTEAATSAISYTVTTAPGNGHLALSASPTVTITSFTQAQLDAGQVVYVHSGTNTTSDSFGFDVDDGAGNAVTGQTFNLSITAVDDDAPTLVVNTGSTVAEGGTDTISNTELAFTDTEAATSAITYSVTTAPGNGHLALSAAPTVAITSFTQAQLDAGQVVYVHDDTNTTSDSFGFDVDDGAGNAVTGQTFNVAITAADDDAPTLVVNTGSTVAEGGTDTISNTELAFTDSEAATSAITYTVTTAPGNGHLALSASPAVAITSFTQAQLDAGQVVYVHGGTNTTSDSFGFDVDDGAGNTVTGQTFNVAITAVDDDAPTLVVNTGSTVAEGGTDTISSSELAFTDTEAATPAISYSVTTAPGNGHLALSAAPTVAITSFTQSQLDAGQVVYVHSGTNTTTDSFGFDVDDGAGNAVTGQTFNLAIIGVDDDAPTQVVNTGSTVSEGGTDTLSSTELAFTDTEAATSAITYTVTTAPGNGHVALSAAPTVAITSFTQAQLDVGQVVYVHDGTNTTSDSFGFDVDDGAGNAVTGQTFNLSITAVDDDAPTLVVNTGSTVAEGGTDTISNTELAFTDTEAATSAITYSVTTAPGNGHLALSAAPTVAITSFTQAQLDAGQVVYVHDGTNTTSDSFGFDVDDGAGNAVTGQTFNVAIIAVDDDAPVASSDSATVAEGGSVVIDLAANDSDFDGPLDLTSIEIVSGPANGSLSIRADGTVQYTHDGSETGSDGFRYTIRDSAGLVSNVGNVVLSVTPVNDGPVMSDQTLSIAENAPNGTPVGVVVASDAEAGPLVYTIQAGNSGGVFVLDAATGLVSVANTAALDYETNSSFGLTVEVRDSNGLATEGQVTIDVQPVNEAPTLSGNSFTAVDSMSNGDMVGAVIGSDPDSGDTLNYAIMGGNSGGAFSIDADTGEIRIANATVLDAGAQSSFALIVEVRDSGTLTDTAIVNIGVAETPQVDPAPDDDVPPIEDDPGPDGGLDLIDDEEPDDGPGSGGDQPKEGPESEDQDEIGEEVPVQPAPGSPPLVLTLEPEKDSTNSKHASRLLSPHEVRDGADEARDVRSELEEAVRFEADDDQAEAIAQTPQQELAAREQLEVQLDSLREEIARQHDVEAADLDLRVGAAEGALAATFAGVLAMLARGSSVVAAMLSSLPLWRKVDPLAVLTVSDDQREALSEKMRAAAREEEEEAAGVARVLDDHGDPRGDPGGDGVDQAP